MPHSTRTISPLRQRMIDEMTQRRLKPSTQRSHILGVKTQQTRYDSPLQPSGQPVAARGAKPLDDLLLLPPT
jgi:hypothetical protein